MEKWTDVSRRPVLREVPKREPIMELIKFEDIDHVLEEYKKDGIILQGGAIDQERGGQWFYERVYDEQ